MFFAGLSGFGAWCVWIVVFDEGKVVLPRADQAAWIRFDHVPRFQGRPRVALPARFRRTFTVQSVPSTATLTLRAYRAAVVKLNGKRLALDGNALANWKRPRSREIASALRPGENRIEVTVTCDSGPPALWLAIRGAGQTFLRSDASWSASWAGSLWRKAHDIRHDRAWQRTTPPSAPLRQTSSATGASSPRQVGAAHLTRRQLNEALVPARMWRRHKLRWLLMAVAAAAVIALARRVKAWCLTSSGDGKVGFSRRGAAVVLAVPTVLWIALLTHNAPLLYRQAGYDAAGHLEYMQHLLDGRGLPLANEGWQMYHPPLYYAVGALSLAGCGLSTSEPEAMWVLRAVGMLIGILQFVVVWLCLKEVFPGQWRKQLIGLTVASMLPASLALAHYPTNEPLAALLSSTSIYLYLRLRRVEEPSLWLSTALGACLGAAVLTKISAVVLVVLIPLAMALRLGTQRRWQVDLWWRAVGVPLLACLVVSGWHFGRVWVALGTPLATNLDYGFSLWQDPGYHTLGYFARFGEAVRHPFDAAVVSFADGWYSTWWGDGGYGGTAAAYFRPPWNYELMAAGYLWSLLPTAAAWLGGMIALVQWVRRPTAVWLLFGATLLGTLAVLVEVATGAPGYGAVKGFYALPALVPFCALVSLGIDFAHRQHRLLEWLLWVALGVWAANSYAGYWIDGNSRLTRIAQAQAAGFNGRDKEAIRRYQTLLKDRPRDATVWYLFASELLKTGQPDAARQAYERLLVINPEFRGADIGLANALAKLHKIDAAIQHARRGLALNPDTGEWGPFLLGQLLHEQSRLDEALLWYRKALRYTPYRASLHRRIANIYAALHQREAALNHLLWAEAIEEATTDSR